MNAQMRARSASLAVLLAVACMPIAGCAAATPAAPAQSPTEIAAKECGLTDHLRDDGRTLILDTQGKTDSTGDDLLHVGCALRLLQAPASVASHMDQTRALDGMQTDEWANVKARWNFHPDTGMNLVLTS